nr:hypothetical protein [Roseobacter litoralis]
MAETPKVEAQVSANPMELNIKKKKKNINLRNVSRML